MTFQLAISVDERAIITEILERVLPPGSQTHVFGSRATGIRLRRTSDLDLVIEGAEPFDWRVISKLNHEFDESMLVYKVDVLDRKTVSESFGAIVDATKVPFA